MADNQIILNGTNYTQWKECIMARIDEIKLRHVTQWSTIPLVNAETDESPDNIAALQQYRQVRGIIVETLDPTRRSMIHNSMTPKAILKLFESKYGSKNPFSRYHLLTYALVGYLSFYILDNFNNPNDDNENDDLKPHVADPLTSLTFNKIYSKGLYSSLERYRDQCVPELKDQIEQTIDSVRSMESSADNDAQLFTFANRRRVDTRPSGVMDYIGIAIRKVNSNNNGGQGQLFDYTIYTYVKPIEPVKRHNLRDFIISIFNLIKRLILGEEEDSVERMYGKDRIEALHISFMAELVKRGVIAKMNEDNMLN